MKKQAEGKQKVQREGKAFKEWESKKSDVIKKTEDAFFAAMGKQEEQHESERSGLEDSHADRREEAGDEEERQEEQQEQQNEGEAEQDDGHDEGEPADVQPAENQQQHQEPQAENAPQGEEQPEAENANPEAGGEAQAESQ